jgi:hypothetical protein
MTLSPSRAMLAADLPIQSRCVKDCPTSNFPHPLLVGEVLRVVNFGMYLGDYGRIRRIKEAR